MDTPAVQVILVPYDSGHRGKRMGAGPEFLWQHGLEDTLSAHQYTVTTVEIESNLPTEIETGFACCRQAAYLVQTAVSEGAFPLVLSGNCMIAAGTTAGLGATGLGTVWFDGHSDFWTPAMTANGMLDSMGLAILNGQCWHMLAGTIPGFRPVPADNLLHVGGRLSFIERNLLNRQGVPYVESAQIKAVGADAALQDALHHLKHSANRVYLHLDLDVLTLNAGQANEFARPDGLSVGQLEEAIQLLKQHFTICGCGIASYDPASDENGAIAEAIQHLVPQVVNP